MRQLVAGALVVFGAAPVRAQSIDTLPIVRAFTAFDTDSTPGCAVAVARPGEPPVVRAFGMADLERGVRNTPATIFEAGSVSKQFTAAAVITLAERGVLSLDDDVRRWFPELPARQPAITIRHLLQHTSGLRDWGAIVELQGWPRGTRTIDHRYVLAVIARQQGLNHPVGAAYSYTNSGYSLLAMLVERASGRSLAAFTRDEFFIPLGMTSTSWRDDHARVVRGRALAYARSGGQWRLDMPFENPHGHGGLLTTVGDLLTWNRALAERTVGSRKVAEIMEATGVLTTGRPITYGGGLVVDSVRGVLEIGHSGATAGYRAHLARYPATGASAAVLCNAGTAQATLMLRAAVAGAARFTPMSSLSVGTNSFVDGDVTVPRTVTPADSLRDMYRGTWRSDEVGATWRITADSPLVLHRHEGDALTLRVVGTGALAGGGITLRAVRQADGTVQLVASIPRATAVPFTRIPDAGGGARTAR